MCPADASEKVKLLSLKVRYEAEGQHTCLSLGLQALPSLQSLFWVLFRMVEFEETIEDKKRPCDEHKQQNQEDPRC